MKKARFFGHGLPGMEKLELPGKLIVIEGTDGVGRTTHINLLHDWLESQGRGVLVTGLSRSPLIGEGLQAAKQNKLLGRLTMALFYATDFADRLEHEIIPALRAGFVVLADRYVYTLIARDTVRGTDAKWLRDLFGFALIPDAVFYLSIDIDSLVPRVLRAGKLNYWEAGMDLGLADNLFDSFHEYQSLLLQEFEKMREEFNIFSISSKGSINSVQSRLRKRIEMLF
ncbi:MAG: thymidylate kinase [Candidatus Omnitrophica bacterium]|nr:MAG: Thymidylate kinase [Candidatus Hinthialibacteria bacterium OLB16]MBE7487563.1 thymidylate kinase [bacterium]MBK7494270.1 thymidylate kinase [Candidatus Omnitrophota bacterium]MCE7909151.1 thymidylate kinase [Candidatus Omnitrophica bacterium COP1]MBV6482903.1 Thymidylate kinase [bacterium]